MARVSKTSPFRPREQPESRSNNEGEKKDEEKTSSSSSTTSSSNSENNTQDKKQAKGKRPMQSRKRNRNMTHCEMINGPQRAKGTVSKRGRGKSIEYTARLWSKYNPRIDVHVSSDDEPKNADPKSVSTQDKKQEKAKGKRLMQAKNGNQKTTPAKGVSERGRGKSAAYTIRLWSKHNPRSPRKGVDTRVCSEFEPSKADPKVKEEDVFQSSETDSEEVCRRINIERHDDDTDNGGRGAGTHRNLTSLGIEVVGK